MSEQKLTKRQHGERGVKRGSNPWQGETGCEVNVCQADYCDAARVGICALRAAYLERVSGLREMHGKVRSAAMRREIEKQLRGLDAWE